MDPLKQLNKTYARISEQRQASGKSLDPRTGQLGELANFISQIGYYTVNFDAADWRTGQSRRFSMHLGSTWDMFPDLLQSQFPEVPTFRAVETPIEHGRLRIQIEHQGRVEATTSYEGAMDYLIYWIAQHWDGAEFMDPEEVQDEPDEDGDEDEDS